MNDFLPLSEETSDAKIEKLQEREAFLVKMIEAIGRVLQSNEWSTLKSLFEDREQSLEKQLSAEAMNEVITDANIYRIQGRLFETRRYNLDTLLETYRLELSYIRKLTQPTER